MPTPTTRSLSSASPRREWLPGLLIVALALAVAAPTFVRGVSFLDEGALLHTAERLTDGEMLYRDVETGLVPGSYWLQALVLWAAGPSILWGRALMAVLFALSCWVVHSILRHLASPGTAWVGAVGYLGWQAYHWRIPNYSCEANLLLLLALWRLLAALPRRNRGRFLVPALLVGLAAVFKQNFGAFAALALAVTVVVSGRRARQPQREVLADLVWVGAGIATPFLAVVGWFALHGAADELLYQVVLLPFGPVSAHFVVSWPWPWLSLEELSDAMRRNLWYYSPVPAGQEWLRITGVVTAGRLWLGARWVYSMAAVVVALGATVYGLLPRVAVDRPGGREARTALVAFAALLLLGAFPRADYHHLVLATPWILLLGVVLAADLAAGLGWRRGGAAAATLAVAVPLGLGVVNLRYWLHHPDPARRQDRRLELPRTGMLVPGWVKEQLEAGVRMANSALGPDEPLVVLSWPALYAYLLDRPDPSPFPLVLPGAMDEGRLMAILEEAAVERVIHSDITVDQRTFRQDFPRLSRYLQERFTIDPETALLEPVNQIFLLRRLRPGEQAAAAGPAPGSRVGLNLLDRVDQSRKMVLFGDGTRQEIPNSWRVQRVGWLFREALLQAPAPGPNKVVVSFGIEAPPGAALAFAVGERPSTWSASEGDGSWMEVFVFDRTGGETHRVWSAEVDAAGRPSDRLWRSARVDLSAWEGHPLVVALVTSGGPRFNRQSGEGREGADLPAWGEPRIELPVATRGAVLPAPADLPEEALEVLRSFPLELFETSRAERPGDPDLAAAWRWVVANQGGEDAGNP